MFKKARLRFTILIVLLTCAIGFIGINTYRKLSSVLEQTGTLMAQRNYRLELQQLRSAMSTADSRIQSFRLTQDRAFVERYHQLMAESSSLLDTLYRYPQDTAQLLLLDTLQQLLAAKEQVMLAIMALENSEGVTSELGVIRKAIAVQPSPPSTQPSGNLFAGIKHLFKRKPAAADSLAQLKSEVSKGLQTVQQNQVKRLKNQKKEEFQLLVENSRIAQHIDHTLQQLEQREEARVKQNVVLAHENAETVRTFNMVFAVSLTLILAAIGLVIISFIHRNQQYTEAIEHTKEEALSLARTKETFLANMSHEIRTPLTAIVGFAEQVSAQPTAENIGKFIPVIARSATFLHHIVNDILDHSKITANKLSFTTQSALLLDVVDELTALFEPRFNDKHITLSVTVQPDGPQVISTDIVRLKQVLINLLSNSLKYTQQGHVSVALVVDDTAQTLTCTIRDTGVGIEPERLPFVFEAFEQARAGAEYKRGSTGLGLSICKKLITLQGGTITLDSTLHKGTTVRFVLPVQTGETEVQHKPSVHASLTGKKILIADDEPFNTQLLRYILHKHQAVCSVCATTHEAVAAVSSQAFDLLLVDYRMPEMNGVAFIEYARQTDLNQHTPFILLTAETSAETLALAHTYGDATLLAKPFSEQELLTHIARRLHTGSHTVVEPVGLGALKQIAHQHPDMYKDLLVTFLSSTRDGIAAMQAAADRQDAATIREWAHKLAPACRHLGAESVLQLLKQLETTNHPPTQSALLAALVLEASHTFAAVEKELTLL